MKCQMLFSGENKKNIIKVSSAELAKRVIKVTIQLLFYYGLEMFFFFLFVCLFFGGPGFGFLLH